MMAESSTATAQARALYIRTSPYKLRPFAAAIRGKRLDQALAWLSSCPLKRANDLKKTVFSAYSNAKSLAGEEAGSLKKVSSLKDLNEFFVQEVRIDQGPTVKYFKPSAMGRAAPQRRRQCHIFVKVARKKS